MKKLRKFRIAAVSILICLFSVSAANAQIPAYQGKLIFTCPVINDADALFLNLFADNRWVWGIEVTPGEIEIPQEFLEEGCVYTLVFSARHGYGTKQTYEIFESETEFIYQTSEH